MMSQKYNFRISEFGSYHLGSEEGTGEKVNSAEIRMFCWKYGVTRRDKVRNEMIPRTVKVAEISTKMQEKIMNWYGHMMSREEDYVERRVTEMEIPGHRERGRP